MSFTATLSAATSSIDPRAAGGVAARSASARSAEKFLGTQRASEAGGSSDSAQGGTRFFSDRLILLCKVFAGIDVVYFTLFTLALTFDSDAGFFSLAAQSFSLETLGEYALFAVIWAACRLRSWSLGALRVLDAILLFGLGVLWSSWPFIHPYPALGAYEMVLALVAAPVLRAVLVPSSGVRTFVLTAIACIPGLSATFVASRMRHMTLMTPATLSVLVLNWCSLGTVFSTVASSVIYGLRAEMKKARRLGQYTLIRKIGQGGMGVVYLARHALLRRRTVVKLLLQDQTVPGALDRFEREVQLTSQLTHPNTIAIYDFGRTEDGAFYYAMEHLDGMDLEGIVSAGGPCPPARIIHVLRQVCGALEEAHAAGLLHRDIKPSNIFLCPRRGPTDVVKVLDFGLVKDIGRPYEPSALTQTGSLIGTPLYMSPELIAAPETIDARSDIYALGVLAYFLLTGQRVFDGASVVQLCAQHLYEAPVPPSLRSRLPIPDDLEQIVLRCLEKDRASRYPDVKLLAAALAACRDAGQWTEEDAAAWWADHPANVAAPRVNGAESAPATIVVDMAARVESEFRRLSA